MRSALAAKGTTGCVPVNAQPSPSATPCAASLSSAADRITSPAIACSSSAVSPVAASARPASSVPRNGPTASALPTSANTTPMSKADPPKPPLASSNSAPITPSSASWAQTGRDQPSAVSITVSRVFQSKLPARNRPKVSTSICRSSPSEKSMAQSSNMALLMISRCTSLEPPKIESLR